MTCDKAYSSRNRRKAKRLFIYGASLLQASQPLASCAIVLISTPTPINKLSSIERINKSNNEDSILVEGTVLPLRDGVIDFVNKFIDFLIISAFIIFANYCD